MSYIRGGMRCGIDLFRMWVTITPERQVRPLLSLRRSTQDVEARIRTLHASPGCYSANDSLTKCRRCYLTCGISYVIINTFDSQVMRIKRIDLSVGVRIVSIRLRLSNHIRNFGCDCFFRKRSQKEGGET